MFKNPGSKLKTIAQLIFWLTIAFYVIFGMVLASRFGIDIAFMVAVGFLLGIAIGWLSSIVLYAFGEMVEDTRKTRVAVEKILKLEEDL